MNDRVQSLTERLSDRYRIDRELGRGGMATVYLAEDLKHHRKVAIKVLKPELAALLGPERFLREIEITAQLNHPHILPLLDSGQADGQLYYIMPFVEGESLRDLLNREKQLPIDDAVDIAKQVASALTYAHGRRVVHRDIKPANILLHNGQASVADFGVAKAISEAGGADITETGLSLGTPHYMSPEQAAADRHLDGRSDIYALGSVVYEMLTGEPPFTGPTTQAVLARIATDKPRDVAELRATAPRHVQAAVHKALSKLPADRFASAAAFAAAVDGSVPIEPVKVASEPPSSGTIAVPKGVVALTGLAIVVLTTIAVWTSMPLQRLAPGPVSRWTVTTTAPNRLVAPDYPPLRVRIRLSPDGSRLAYIGGSATDRRLVVRRFDTGVEGPVPGTEGAYSLFWHPDGELLAFATMSDGRTELKTAKLPDGPVTSLAHLPGELGGAAWGRNDTIILGQRETVADVGLGLYRLPAAGGTPDPLTVPDTTEDTRHVWPNLLPGDNKVLFTATRAEPQSGSGHTIWALDLQTGEQKRIGPGRDARFLTGGYITYVRPDGVLVVAAFDIESLEVTGTPVPVLDEIDPRPARGDYSLSDNGTLAFIPEVQAREQLVLVDRGGLARPASSLRGDFYFPRFSRDGRRMAVSARWAGSAERSWQVHVLDTDRAPIRVGFGAGMPSFSPAWSPSSDSLAWESRGRIAWSAANGSGRPEVILSSDTGYVFTDRSWDGRFLVFNENAVYQPRLTSPLGDNAPDLWYIALPGDRKPRLYYRSPASETGARFAPDGRYVAYVSNESGRSEVYVRTFPNPEGGAWQISQNGGEEPAWAPDGKELFFWNGNRFNSVSVNTTSEFRLGAPRVLFEGDAFKRWSSRANYDVHPDGDDFLMIALAPSSDIVVVLNWTDEVRRLVNEASD